MIPPSSSDRAARQRIREQASRRVATTTRALGVVSVAGAAALGLAFSHIAPRHSSSASGPAKATTPPATAPPANTQAPTAPAATAAPAAAPATPAPTVSPTTQAPQPAYQAPVATSGGS